MPYSVRKPCTYFGCRNLVSKGSRCPDHPLYKERVIPEHHKLYSTAKWKKLRILHLRTEPACIVCNTQEDLDVDHIVPHKGDIYLFFDPKNLQTRCHVHHSQKTAKETYG
jgi:5-methylcytosine-specific restriction protein A